MIFRDLREFIERVKETNDVKEVSGADWDLEIGAITDISSELAQRRGARRVEGSAAVRNDDRGTISRFSLDVRRHLRRNAATSGIAAPLHARDRGILTWRR